MQATQTTTKAKALESGLDVWWTLGSVGVALAFSVAAMLDVLTTLIWYASGGVDGNPITRRVIAAFSLSGWAIMRCALALPFILLLVLVPQFLPARFQRRYLVCTCALVLVLVAVQAQTIYGNLVALHVLR